MSAASNNGQKVIYVTFYFSQQFILCICVTILCAGNIYLPLLLIRLSFVNHIEKSQPIIYLELYVFDSKLKSHSKASFETYFLFFIVYKVSNTFFYIY